MPVLKIKQNGEWVDVAGGGGAIDSENYYTKAEIDESLVNLAYINEEDATTDKITILFADKAMTIPAFPRTKIKAVSDDNGVGLDAILNGVVYAEEYNSDVTMVPLNADTFGGYTVDTFIDKIYPVGSIYMSVNAVSPATLFGGTWEALQDRFLLAAGSTYPAGSTGGEATHTLTVDEMPSHRHSYTVNIQHVDGEQVSGESLTSGLQAGGRRRYSDNTDYKGGSQPHNNMPPYLTVYIWKRTA